MIIEWKNQSCVYHNAKRENEYRNAGKEKRYLKEGNANRQTSVYKICCIAVMVMIWALCYAVLGKEVEDFLITAVSFLWVVFLILFAGVILVLRER